jgi:hypothetical protein
MSSIEEEKRNNAALKAAGITKKSECVHVVLRCRPMNKKELQVYIYICIQMYT